MSYKHNTVKIICDSLHPTTGVRLTTFECKYPRYIHSEIMTHRILSRNAQSSRAIPAAKRMRSIRENPVTPIRWGLNQKGMQAKDEELIGDDLAAAMLEWNKAAENALQTAEKLDEYGLHKQWVNRVIENFDTITVIITATTYDNLFGLRCHPDAQPEFQDLAWKMADLYYYHQFPEARQRCESESPPIPTTPWFGRHLPYVTDEELKNVSAGLLVPASVARCARVSYLTHDGEAPSLEKDKVLHDRLLADGHMSPFEHQAHIGTESRSGNFHGGWIQYRKTIRPEVRTFDYLAALTTRKTT